MIAYVYKPRRTKAGKQEVSRIYRGRFRLHGDCKVTEVSLETSDKHVAEKKLAQIVNEHEREKAGLIAPKLQRVSAQKSIMEHLEDFKADLMTLGRSKKYGRLLTARIGRVTKECGWRFPGSVSANDFVQWRSQQTKAAPKTLNEYLNAANALLNWMERQGRIESNPLRKVPHADLRGRQQKRRAYSDDELNRLLAVAGNMRVFYLAAAYTGLRLAELQQLVWGDVKFDHDRPHIAVRAPTTKNRKDAIVPLHPQLLAELKACKPVDAAETGKVFTVRKQPYRRIRNDMAKAGIARFDGMGRKLDFHALRYTFATKLAERGVSQRLAQELMRHSDPRLTANIYTDVSRLPTFEAVNSLSWTGDARPQKAPQLAPQNPVFLGLELARNVTPICENRAIQTPQEEGNGHEKAGAVAPCQMVEVAGVEPACP